MQDKVSEAVEGELLTEDEVEALVAQRVDEMMARTSRPLLESLLGSEQAEAVIARRTAVIEAVRVSALKRTRPEDWILNKGRDGSITGMLAASGADLVAEIYGINAKRVWPMGRHGQPEPERKDGEGGVFTLTLWGEFECSVNGRRITLEAARRSDEEFLGRSTGEGGKLVRKMEDKTGSLESDHRSAVTTLLHKKAVVRLSGMARVPLAELEEAWAGTKKTANRCQRGSGFGTGDERVSSKVAEEGAKEAAEGLWFEILRCANGDTAEAAKILQEITANPEKGFKGISKPAQLTAGWQVERAKKALLKHRSYRAEEREPGED